MLKFFLSHKALHDDRTSQIPENKNFLVESHIALIDSALFTAVLHLFYYRYQPAMRMYLKDYLFIHFFFFTLLLSAQEMEAFQSDSIYRANKVKSCKITDYNNGYHHSTTYFNKSGRIMRLVKSDNKDLANMGKYYTEINTYYVYADDGKLISMIDSIKTRMPTPEEAEAIKKMGPIGVDFLDQIREFPPLKTNTYELIYQNDEMVLTKKYDANGFLILVDSISKKGALHKKYSYIDRVLDQVEFISYTHQGYPCAQIRQVTDGEYWYESEYSYMYEFEGGVLIVLSGVRHDGETAETKYVYNENGLVIRRLTGFYGSDQNSVELYAYEFYD